MSRINKLKYNTLKLKIGESPTCEPISGGLLSIIDFPTLLVLLRNPENVKPGLPYRV